MVKVLLFLGELAILLVSSRQVFLMFRDGSFRARGNRLIVRDAHPIIFWIISLGSCFSVLSASRGFVGGCLPEARGQLEGRP